APPAEAKKTPDAAPPRDEEKSRPRSRPAPPRSSKESPSASPAVRRRAAEHGIKLQYVQGTGDGGRITHSDLDAFVAGDAESIRYAPQGGGFAKRQGTEDIPIIGMRRQIAERMQQSKRNIPHFSYVEEVDVTELEALRRHLNQVHSAERGKLTLLPFLIRAIANILPEHPQ
ncbi:MAG: 2-oxo acid dehydrogenase subunit E2, partial [Rhodospirillaceae bacterium]